MLGKATEIVNKYNQVTSGLVDASTQKNAQLYKSLMMEGVELKNLYPLALEYIKAVSDLDVANEMLQNAIGENRHFVLDEIHSLQAKISDLTKKIETASIKTDPDDKRNIILEIRPGTGGEEASLFANELLRMYLRYFEVKKWVAEQYNLSTTESGGVKEAIYSIKGKNVYGAMKYESGVHRVQRIPVTEASGRIHTSTASVVIFPEFDDIEIQINPEDVRIDVFRSGGPGGQSVNTTDSAVRITHIPTGIVVSCQDEKSQLKNKHRAFSVLKSRLYSLELLKKQENESELRNDAIKGGDRSAKIRTYNFPQNRVTDHRIKTSWYNLESILSGNIQEIVDQVRQKINLANPLGDTDDDN
jgi:peptide chain release factor 1